MFFNLPDMPLHAVVGASRDIGFSTCQLGHLDIVAMFDSQLTFACFSGLLDMTRLSSQFCETLKIYTPQGCRSERQEPPCGGGPRRS